jgi:hypothetical protein
MKKSVIGVRILAAVAFILAGLMIVPVAQAVPITGGFSMGSGAGAFVPVDAAENPTTLGAAVGIDFIPPPKGLSGPFTVSVGGNGSYSGLVAGTVGTIKDFSFTPAFNTVNFPFPPIATFWTVTLAGLTYTLDLLTISVSLQNDTFLNLSGTGTAHITGVGACGSTCDPTPGVWNFSAQSAVGGGQFSWSASTGVESRVIPEPATLLLVGSAIVGLGASVARRRRSLTK